MIASQPHQPAIATSPQNQRSSFHPQTSDRLFPTPNNDRPFIP